MGVNWSQAANVFNQTTSNLSEIAARKKRDALLEQQLQMEQELQPLRIAGAQQGLDLGALQLADIRHGQSLWPEQDALRTAMDAINLNINKINLKGARNDAEFKAQEQANARILNPLIQMAAMATLGSRIAESKVNQKFNSKILDSLNTAKDHLQSEQNKLAGLEAAARGNIDQLMAQLEAQRPGFSADTATRKAALRFYIDKTGKGFAPNDVLGQMLQLLAGGVDQQQSMEAGRQSVLNDFVGPPLPPDYVEPSSNIGAFMGSRPIWESAGWPNR